MTRRLTLEWPDPRPFRQRDGRPIRLLAASDEPDPTLDHAANREALGELDLVVGCGDLGADRLAFLGDAFRAPLVYVRGNHDRGGAWRAADRVPVPSLGIDQQSLPGVTLLALPWPGALEGPALRDEGAAWWQVDRARTPEPASVARLQPRAATGRGRLARRCVPRRLRRLSNGGRPPPAAALAPRPHLARRGPRPDRRARPDDARQRDGLVPGGAPARPVSAQPPHGVRLAVTASGRSGPRSRGRRRASHRGPRGRRQAARMARHRP